MCCTVMCQIAVGTFLCTFVQKVRSVLGPVGLYVFRSGLGFVGLCSVGMEVGVTECLTDLCFRSLLFSDLL